MTCDNGSAAYWTGYEAGITGKEKPNCEKYQLEVEKGYFDAKYDLARQLIHTEQMFEGEEI